MKIRAAALVAIALTACDPGKAFVISNPCDAPIRAGGFITRPPTPVVRKLLVEVPAGGTVTTSDLGTSSEGTAVWLILSRGLADQRIVRLTDDGEGQMALSIPESQCPWIEGAG